MSWVGSAENWRLMQLGLRYGATLTGSGTVEELYAARDLGKQIETRLQAVEGYANWNLQQLEYAEKSNAIPQMPEISVNNISNNAASVNWFTGTQYTNKPQITNFHFLLKNQDTGQTISELKDISPQAQNTYVSNLETGTNYKGYLIAVNAIGNSPENSIGFKTTGIKVEPEPEPEPIIISVEVQAILTKFDNNDYEYPYTDLPALISYVKNGTLSNENFLITINQLLDQKTIIDKTITITPIITYCVNVYTLDSSGNVLSDHYDKINLLNLQNLLSENKYVFYCKDGIIPTEQQVRDFYGYTAPVEDSSINSMMVSQSVGAFILKDGRLKGEILYIANQSFNPFYYGKNLTSLVQIKSKTGIPIAVKPNNLNFTNTERDERIQIDEAVGNFKELIVDFFVWKSTTDLRAFTADKQIQVVEELPPPDEPKPCQIGYHKDFSGKCVPDDPLPEIPRDKLIDTLKGFLFGTVALSLLARKY
jgi:hypothetical protein